MKRKECVVGNCRKVEGEPVENPTKPCTPHLKKVGISFFLNGRVLLPLLANPLFVMWGDTLASAVAAAASYSPPPPF